MKGKKILIIDDDPDFSFLMSEFFSKKGGKVLLADSIGDGLRILQKEKTDYIFLDNNLPDGLGWTKSEFILVTYPDAQLILISSQETQGIDATLPRILFKPLISVELHKMFD